MLDPAVAEKESKAHPVLNTGEWYPGTGKTGKWNDDVLHGVYLAPFASDDKQGKSPAYLVPSAYFRRE